MSQNFSISQFTSEELARELLTRTLVNEQGLLSKELYELRMALGTLVCVDGIPLRYNSSGDPELMAIRRNTGPYKGKLCYVGGIVPKGAPLKMALEQHFKRDLGLDIGFSYNMVFVCEYLRPDSLGNTPDHFLPEPTKDHNVGITYVVKIVDDQQINYGVGTGGQEASGVVWFSEDNMPSDEEFGYGQSRGYRKVFDKLKINRKGS